MLMAIPKVSWVVCFRADKGAYALHLFKAIKEGRMTLQTNAFAPITWRKTRQFKTVGPLDQSNFSELGVILNGPSEKELHDAFIKAAFQNDPHPYVYFLVVMEFQNRRYIVPVWATVIGCVPQGGMNRMITGTVYVPPSPYNYNAEQTRAFPYDARFNVGGRLGRMFYSDLARIVPTPGMVLSRTNEVVTNSNIVFVGKGESILLLITKVNDTDVEGDFISSHEDQGVRVSRRWRIERDVLLQRYFHVIPPELGPAMWQERLAVQ
jgi:hypothetical protein